METLLVVGSVFFVIFFFGFCIFIHELGHFLAAKWRGLHINAFSIGFRKAWGFTWKGVEYRIGWLPFGGYVDLPQIDPSNEEVKATADGKELPPVKPIDRLITAAAGPIFNIIAGFALGTLIWIYGIPQSSPVMKYITVQSVDKQSPEYEAGLRKGDKIVKINNETINSSWEKFVHRILFTVGDVKLTVQRDGKTFDLRYTPVENPNYLKKEKIAYPFFTPRIPFELTPDKNSPAALAGIQKGDILLAVNGRKIADLDNTPPAILLASGKLDLLISRNGTELEIKNIEPIVSIKPDDYVIGVILSPGNLIEMVRDGSPAARAGLMKDDVLVAVDDHKLTADDNLIDILKAGKGTTVEFTVARAGKNIKLNITPEHYKEYYSGMNIKFMAHPTPWDLFVNVIDMSYKSLRGIYFNMAHKAGVSEQSSTIKARNMSGPLGIVTMMYRSVRYGSFMQGIFLVVIITFSLGLLNLFPLPILDGGHIVFSVIEMVIGKPLPHKYVQPVNIACVFFLISFMLYVTVFDVNRLLPDMDKTPVKTAEENQSKDVSKPAETMEKINEPAPANP
ncbi:MAG: site-2 protease family protein [Victivallales bacterium]|nr:site-2 protease family protein [Victivallales bacterium]